MNILIAGASGLIGTALVQQLEKTHHLHLLGRNLQKLKQLFPMHSSYEWSQIAEAFAKVDVAINLCGENIGEKRWTARRKEEILRSRLTSTTLMVEHCLKNKIRLLNASAIGIYGLSKAAISSYDESYPAPSQPQSFLEEVAVSWEKATAPLQAQGIPVVNLRFGVVLSSRGGALSKLLPIFKLGLGGKMGNGQQYLSWISLQDAIRAIAWLLEFRQITGPVNIVAPHSVTQQQFAEELAKTLHRPSIFTFPRWWIKILLGEMGEELLLEGVKATPSALKQHGFVFHHANLSEALAWVLNSDVNKG